MVRIEENGIIGEGETRKEAEKALRIAIKEEEKARIEREKRFHELRNSHYQNIGRLVCRSFRICFTNKEKVHSDLFDYGTEQSCVIEDYLYGLPSFVRLTLPNEEPPFNILWYSLVPSTDKEGKFIKWDDMQISSDTPLQKALFDTLESEYQIWLAKDSHLETMAD